MNWGARIQTRVKTGYCLMAFLILTGSSGYCGDLKDSAIQAVQKINEAYSNRKLNEKRYMDTMYVTMRDLLSANIHFSSKELLTLLGPYRKVVWSQSPGTQYKRNFYGILSNEAQMSGKYGEMLYYAERINQLQQIESKRPSLTALSIIADYYLTHASYDKVKNLFEQNKAYLQTIPDIAGGQEMHINDVVQAVIVLQKSAQALFELKDILAGTRAFELIQKIDRAANTRTDINDNVKANITFLSCMAEYQYATVQKNALKQQELFRRMTNLQQDKQTPDYMKYYIESCLIDWKIAFYLHHHNTDSSAHYIKIYKAFIQGEAIPYNRYLLHKYQAQNLYNTGRFRASADMLNAASDALDSTRATLINDIDEMMYARVKAEDQQVLLTSTEVAYEKTKRRLRIILSSSMIFLLTIISAFFFYRQLQKNKFLRFKLNLARNIHDETNPALLHARVLARSFRKSDTDEKTELEKNIEHTMILIRSLSHDLKSTKQQTIADVIHHTEDILNKLNIGNTFNYKITRQLDIKRLISHYQFAELKAILNECITNSIKHANFDEINISFIQKGSGLMISYSDNGKGWDTPEEGTGIGLQNMRERVQRLNADFSLVNDYPNRYQIHITLQLR